MGERRGRVRPQLEEEDGDWDMLLASLEEDEGPCKSPPCEENKQPDQGNRGKREEQFAWVSPRASKLYIKIGRIFCVPESEYRGLILIFCL